MTRTVHQINVARERPEEATPRPFSDFATTKNLVLLGDPGAGKTHLFRDTAAREGARFLKARAFLVMPANMLADQALFIDGLDEKRAGRGDQDTIDAIVKKLFGVNPVKVRISCRAADWLGGTDLSAFNAYFGQSDEPAILVLERLSLDEQEFVLASQGVDVDIAKGFLAEAQERGLANFLENPQNLIMLWRAVQTGSWPANRKDLFQLSTELMLQEADPDHARTGGGIYSVAELRPVAGAICAARLISDVEAVSLANQEGSADAPGYRSLTFLEPEKTLAALGRRVFVTGSEPESVDYAHRTTAEYLAAEFLARRIRAGLPFGRVAALIGVDGHPASELRGLHAWLAVHLPEHTDELIEADPYGVLTYGDASSLSQSSCAYLVRALARLSQTNPWFRSGNWQSRSIGALARSDMIDEFRAVLGDPNAGFGVRSVIIEALWLGTPLPEMIPELTGIISDDGSPYAQRLYALLGLLRLGDRVKAAIIHAFRKGLGGSINGLRLRSEIIERLYGEPFGSADVIAMVNDTLKADFTLSTAMFWTLADNIPVGDLPDILDGINAPKLGDGGYDRRTWDIGSFYVRILIRAWRAPEVLDDGRVLNWLCKRRAFREGHGESRAQELRSVMNQTPERVLAIAEYFVRTLIVDDDRWSKLMRFRETVLLPAGTLLKIIVRHMDSADEASEKQLFLYEAALTLSYQAEPPDAAVTFGKLYDLADSKTFLDEVRSRSVVLRLPDGYFAAKFGRVADNEQMREEQRHKFEGDAESIRAGAHIGWLAHLGRIYFAWYSDTDRSLSPRQRLATWLGEANVETALAGLRAVVSRNDLPTLADVMTLVRDYCHYDWWYAIVAGLNERWGMGEDLDELSDDVLKGLVAFDLTNPVSSIVDGTDHWLVHPWKRALLDHRPELVCDAYLAIVRARMSGNRSPTDGLRELLTEASFEPFRKNIVLQLLRHFPNTTPNELNDMLEAMMKLSVAHPELRALAGRALSGAILIDDAQRDMWLATAYLLSPTKYECEVEARARTHPGLVFNLRDRSGFTLHGQPQKGTLQLPVLEFMARLTGTLFPETPYPDGGSWGSTNQWNAAEYFRGLVNTISSIPSTAATRALVRLETNPDLASYAPFILYALANQRQRWRDAEYDRPDWPSTVRSLDNGAPATVAELHALLAEYLRDLKQRIERENIDLYKQFWNVDGAGKLVDPRPEEVCRDYLVGLMRPTLLPRGITIEPEAHMVADRRADISVAMPGRKILCELKRDYHADVWTAAQRQLDRFYAHDPESKGFGIYCVFWFGKRPRQIPTPPNGLNRPQSASEMEQMLKGLLPENMRSRIAIIVMDVSGHH